MRLALMLVPLLASCGVAEITGVYRTSSAAHDLQSCQATTATTTPAFFVVQESELLGLTLLTVRGCPSADVATCEALGPLTSAPLTLGSSDGWEGGGSTALGLDGQPCTYGQTTITALFTDETETLAVVAEERGATRASATCSAEEVPEDLPCVEARSVTGVRVGPAPPRTSLLGL
jgi:hypothetical protein